MQNLQVQLMTLIPDHLRPLNNVLMETSGSRQQNSKWTTISLMAHGSSLIYLLMQNALILDVFSVLNKMQMVPLSDKRLVSLLKATVNVLALITLKYSLLPSDIQLSAPLSHLQL